MLTSLLDPRAWTSGRVLRVLIKTPRKADEQFLLEVPQANDQARATEILHGEPPRWTMPDPVLLEDRLPAGAVVVDEYRFNGQPMLGPLTIYRRSLPASDDPVATAALHARPPWKPTVATPRAPLERVDASAVEPMDDDEFWGWIATLEGRIWEKTIDRLARQLSELPEERVLAFAQALALKYFELDRPDLGELWTDVDGVVYSSGPPSEWIRGAVIGGGRQRFIDVSARPESFDNKWANDTSVQVRFIPGFALTRKRQSETVIIETRWSTKGGVNPEFWGEGAPQVRERDDEVSRRRREEWQAFGEEWRAGQERLRQAQAEMLEPLGIDFDDFEAITGWRAARFFAAGDKNLDEVIILLASKGEEDQAGEVARVVDGWVRADGSRLVGDIERLPPYSYPFSSRVFEIVRKSSLTAEDYLAQYDLAVRRPAGS